MLSRENSGFSLLEMMMAILLLMVISGSAFQAMSYYQKSYLSTQQRIDMHTSVRGAIELLTQEVGQAGLLSFTPRTLSSAVSTSGSSQSVALSSTTDIFAGEKLLIDVGSAQELVTATSVTATAITGVFGKNHASGARVNAEGIFAQGVMSSSTSTQLMLFGDLYADGSLLFAQYNCDYVAGTFTRSVTPVSAASINPSQVLISNVVPNPDGSACFQKQTKTSGVMVFVTSVAVTLTVQTAQKDPQTNKYVMMTKSFLNIAPRNVLDGVDAANNALLARVQLTPPNLPLH